MEAEYDPLARMTATAYSPDQLIAAKLSNKTQIQVKFRNGAYGRYRQETLESQLSQLATRLWVEYRRSYFRALSEVRGETITGDEPEQSPKMLRFRKAQGALPVEGESPKGWVRLRSTGLVRWQVGIKAGALTRLSETEFLAELGAAVRELMADYFAQMRRLKDEYFDLRLPDTKTLETRR